MGNNDIAERKLDMLMRAYEKANRQDEALTELRDAAFEVLLLHPGVDRKEWMRFLLAQYGSEVIDAFGTDATEICASLEKLWKAKYLDENSGLERSFEKWAQALATDEAVQMYYDLLKQIHAGDMQEF